MAQEGGKVGCKPLPLVLSVTCIWEVRGPIHDSVKRLENSVFPVKYMRV